MTAAEMIKMKLIDSQKRHPERTQVWLQERLGIAKSALWNKFKHDTFTAAELIKIAVLLDLDLNEFKSTVPKTKLED